MLNYTVATYDMQKIKKAITTYQQVKIFNLSKGKKTDFKQATNTVINLYNAIDNGYIDYTITLSPDLYKAINNIDNYTLQ